MPIYEYECSTCGHRFEKLVKAGAEPPPCPQCASQSQKLISHSSFVLKGGGWYKDHYGLKPSDKGGDAKPAEAKTESKTESKPAAAETKAAPATPPPAAK